MDYVEPILAEHVIEIRIPRWNGVAKGELLGQDRLKVANGEHTGAAKFSNFLDVAVSDFPAANYSNVQHCFLSLLTLAASSGRVCAAAMGSRCCRMASMARYICQAETK